MSTFSGKCDLADHIAGMGGWYDKNGNSVKFGQKDVQAYYSNFLKDFEAFKAATGGILYQYVKLAQLDDYSAQRIAERYPDTLTAIKHVEVVKDKRCKSGTSEKVSYTYKYNGTEYASVKELNKHGVFLKAEIKIDTMLDLIPYLPYIVVSYSSHKDKQTVVIDTESYAEREYKDMLNYGGCGTGMIRYYRKALADFYFQVCKNYLCYKLDERTVYEDVDLDKLVKADDGYYFDCKNKIDTNQSVEWSWVGTDVKHTHWTSPQIVDDTKLLLSTQDVEVFLADDIKTHKVQIKYVKYPDDGFPLYLD